MCLHVKHPSGPITDGLYESAAIMADLINRLPPRNRHQMLQALSGLLAQIPAVRILESIADGRVIVRDNKGIDQLAHGLGPDAEAVLLQASQN